MGSAYGTSSWALVSVGGVEEKSAGGSSEGERRRKESGEVGAVPSPAASDSVRISAPPAAGWIQPSRGEGERERKLALALALAVLGKVVYVSASGSGCCSASARALRRRVALSSLSRGRGLLRRELTWLRVVKGLE